jgi:predicted nucleotide-binding protein
VARRPAVWVASSSHHVAEAKAIQLELADDCDCKVWDQGTTPGEYLLADLMERAKESDFGIFVLAADDLLVQRRTLTYVTRDNVIFELGLFMGTIGTDRCFLIVPSDREVDLPRDLGGLTPLRYRSDDRDRLRDALRPACESIARAIAVKGLRAQISVDLWRGIGDDAALIAALSGNEMVKP